MELFEKIEKSVYCSEFTPKALTESYNHFKSNPDVVTVKDGTDEEFLLVPTNLLDEYPVTFLSINDLESLGYDTKNVSKDTMQEIASKMGEMYCEDGFWIDLDIQAGECGLTKIPEDEETEE